MYSARQKYPCNIIDDQQLIVKKLAYRYGINTSNANFRIISHLFHQNSNNHTYIYPYFALNKVHIYITKESDPFSIYFIPVYLMFFLNVLCMYMQTVTYNSIGTNIHKKLFNKLIITANTIPNNAIKDKFFVLFCFLNKKQGKGKNCLIRKDSLYL